MTLQEIRDFVRINIRYKHDWEFHVKEKNGVMFLQIQFMAVDNTTEPADVCDPPLQRQYCRKWQLSEWMTPTEIVRTVYKAVIAAEIHEASELFKFKDAAIFNPHIDVERMVEIAHQHDCRE